MRFIAARAAPDGLVPEPFRRSQHRYCESHNLTSLCSDTVDQILARTFDAGEFDELETVWMLSAYVPLSNHSSAPKILIYNMML